MNSLTPHIEIQANRYKLIKLKEEIIIQYIFDINLKGFLFEFKNVENITNYIFKSKGAKRIKKFSVYWFVKHWIELKMYFNCIYNFQRVFYKDFKLIEKWFQLVVNI